MTSRGSGWVHFWNKGTWWKALLLVAVYWVVYQLLGFVINAIFGGVINKENPLADPLTVLVGLALPVLLSGGLLFLFVRSVGWAGEVFGRQPLQGRAWMWLAVVLILVPIVLRLMATNWSAYSVTLVLVTLFFGLCVGFTEELATRGIVVNMLRHGGYGECLVLVLSSLYFALLHSGNALTGQAPLVVAITVVYTFGFGAMMYLSMRVTGRLVWAILLHAATDPTTFLATGGIDAHGDTSGAEGLLSIAGLFNFVYILIALVAIFLVRDRVNRISSTYREPAIASEPTN
ncbi:CPBP family intramembrane glutamic endopeptidase (plasmid) [Paenarthrobacter sp. FR1]